jgi:hypothetical protein
MLIGILDNSKSYLPEKFAYEKYLVEKNHKVIISKQINDLVLCDYIIMFAGLFAFPPKTNAKIIHDYASMSTPPFAKIKDFIKVKVSYKPYYRIFNSHLIKKKLNFNDNIPYLIRPAGVNKKFFFKKNNRIKKTNSIVYAGSVLTRPGLDRCLLQLCKLKIKIVVAGEVNSRFIEKFKKFKNIKFTGVLNQSSLIKLYRQSTYGLNFIPNIFPWKYQNSLKLLEYCASNLKIVTNEYYFVRNFEKKNLARFLRIDNLNTYKLSNFNFIIPNVKKYEWQNLLRKINFEKIFKKN